MSYKEFDKLQNLTCKNYINFFLAHNLHFSLLCETSKASFNPALPSDLSARLREISKFSLAGYTFESIFLDSSHISFEAGFGEDNFGSVVSISFGDILALSIDDIKGIESGVYARIDPGLFFENIKTPLQAILKNKNKSE
ncbi:MAG: hypothetical protein E7K04_04225 [Helicobacter sp.]|nr:hypothetical protein [Helicobacter sp.]